MLLPDVRGIGIDVLDVARFRVFLVRHEERLGEIFTPAELSAAASQGRRDLYLATRWALKEAVLKALGTGWGSGVEWTDIEVVGGLFAPRIVLHGTARQAARRSGGQGAVGSASGSEGTIIAMAALTTTSHSLSAR